MSHHNHDIEGQGAKPRDHEHPRHHGEPGRRGWRNAHRDWRVQVAVVIMLAMVLVYVFTDSLSLRPGKTAVHPTPEANIP